ncbi:MAG: acetolactate synthase small subunit [Peptococcaceae bacterium]|nr:acetolactate synthase small subunit [Peptococcaceae bacterium]
MKHKLAVLVENNPGVLAKVSNLFSRRGYNIESLVVSDTEDKTVSRMTIVVDGDEKIIEQVTKQLHKLVDVIKVNDLTNDDIVSRQLLLVRVAADHETRAEIIQIMDIFRARIIDIGRRSMIIEATGDEDKIEAIVKSLQPFGIQEIVKTGVSAMVRSPKEKYGLLFLRLTLLFANLLAYVLFVRRTAQICKPPSQTQKSRRLCIGALFM